jgi:hypothetical protein
MKTTRINPDVMISREELEEMTKEVKETVAFDCAKNKTFTSADLWNIQRQRKQPGTRRNA